MGNSWEIHGESPRIPGNGRNPMGNLMEILNDTNLEKIGKTHNWLCNKY